MSPSRTDPDLRAQLQATDEQLQVARSHMQLLADSMTQKVLIKNRDLRYVFVNRQYAGDFGITPADMVGQDDFEFYPRELADKYRADDQRIMSTGEPEDLEEPYQHGGQEFWVHTVKTPVRDAAGAITGVLGLFWDVTGQKQAEHDLQERTAELQRHRDHLEELVNERTRALTEANERLETEMSERQRRDEIIGQQAEEIMELSTPVLRIAPGVVLSVLIGNLDSQRTNRFLEVLLESVAAAHAEVVLVDITAVPTVDTQTAQHIIEAVSAVGLLGARVILTGIRPSIAQTLVHLGIDLTQLETCASLAAGLRLATARTGSPQGAAL